MAGSNAVRMDFTELDDDYEPALGKANEIEANTPPFTHAPFSTPKSNNKRRNTSPTAESQSKTRKTTTEATDSLKKKYVKLFINIENCKDKKQNYNKFNQNLTGNKHHKYITHLTRSKDQTGYILTFTSEQHANHFTNTKFNNDLDNATIRQTRKPTRNTHTDILIHNVDTDITTDEITTDIEATYDIQVHSTYRLTRQSQHPPHDRYDTYTVKITINTADAHLFNEHITLFKYNKFFKKSAY